VFLIQFLHFIFTLCAFPSIYERDISYDATTELHEKNGFAEIKF